MGEATTSAFVDFVEESRHLSDRRQNQKTPCSSPSRFQQVQESIDTIAGMLFRNIGLYMASGSRPSYKPPKGWMALSHLWLWSADQIDIRTARISFKKNLGPILPDSPSPLFSGSFNLTNLRGSILTPAATHRQPFHRSTLLTTTVLCGHQGTKKCQLPLHPRLKPSKLGKFSWFQNGNQNNFVVEISWKSCWNTSIT